MRVQVETEFAQVLRNRNGTDVLSFANQVSNYATLLADLEIFRSESNQFGSSPSASDE
jgi:hypothetical protein